MKTQCPLCRSWDHHECGTVTIWHPETLSSLRRKDDPVKLVSCVCACTCKAGDKLTIKVKNGQTVPWLDRFGDKDWHVLRTHRQRAESGFIFDPAKDVEEHGTEKLQRLIANKPPNYVDSFDDWNNGT